MLRRKEEILCEEGVGGACIFQRYLQNLLVSSLYDVAKAGLIFVITHLLSEIHHRDGHCRR